MKATPQKQYLGDSVYADFDGHNIILTTENGNTIIGNTIILEPEVIAALERFVKGLRAVPEKAPTAGTSHPYLESLKLLSEKYGKRAAVLAPFADALLLAGITSPNPYSDGLHFYGLTHDQVIAGIRILGGKWSKKLGDSGTIDYLRDEPMDGLTVAFYNGAPPPSCKIVEEEVEVPEKVIPAHTTKVRRMVCKEGV